MYSKLQEPRVKRVLDPMLAVAENTFDDDLVMFDLRSKLPWSKRLTTRTKKVGKKRVRIVGC